MKLAQIRLAEEAWRAVATLKKGPKLAYMLLKYEQKVTKELTVIEKQRDALIYETAGIIPEPPPAITICQIPEKIQAPGEDPTAMIVNPKYMEFLGKFTKFLDEESELPLIPMTMEELVAGLDAKDGNTISERHLEILEPFFQEAAASA